MGKFMRAGMLQMMAAAILGGFETIGARAKPRKGLRLPALPVLPGLGRRRVLPGRSAAALAWRKKRHKQRIARLSRRVRRRAA